MDKTVRSAEADQKNYMRREEYTKKRPFLIYILTYSYVKLFVD